MASARTPAAPLGARLGIPSSGRLARRAASGDQRAFEEIFRRYHQELYRYCLAIVRQPEDAQDAVQATMAAALRALPGEEREIALRPWLYRIAHNESISLLRGRIPTANPDRGSEATGLTPEAELADRDRLRQLVADLRALPERQRSAIVMRELSDLSYAEIGGALACSEPSARQCVYEARQGLHELAEGRAMECEAVRKAISTGDRRRLRGRSVSSHLRSCDGCLAFEASIAQRRSDLQAICPAMPALAAAGLLSSLLGGSGSGAVAGSAGVATAAGVTGGSAAAGAGIAGAVAVKGASIAAAVVVAAGAADVSGVVDLPGPLDGGRESQAGGGGDPGGGPVPDTSDGRGGESPSADSGEKPRRSGDESGGRGDPREVGTDAARSGASEPGRGKSAPGQDPSGPGNSENAPGNDPSGPGNSENAPGNDPSGPGNSENAPGRTKSEDGNGSKSAKGAGSSGRGKVKPPKEVKEQKVKSPKEPKEVKEPKDVPAPSPPEPKPEPEPKPPPPAGASDDRAGGGKPAGVGADAAAPAKSVKGPKPN